MINNTLYERMNRIRNLINMPRRQHALMQDISMWHMLCESMDTIEDTEQVLEDFLKEDVDDSDTGIGISSAFDILDSLVAQQTAVEELYEALTIPYSSDYHRLANASKGIIRRRQGANYRLSHPFGSNDMPTDAIPIGRKRDTIKRSKHR